MKVEDALLLVATVRTGLINGHKHYDEAGTLMVTELEIIHALLDGRNINVDNSRSIVVTTEDEQLMLVNKEYGLEK